MQLRSLKDNLHGVVDLGVVLMIGIAFVALVVVSYIIYQLEDQLNPTGAAANTIGNITDGFDNAIALLMVAITVFILAIAIAALYIIKARR